MRMGNNTITAQDLKTFEELVYKQGLNHGFKLKLRVIPMLTAYKLFITDAEIMEVSDSITVAEDDLTGAVKRLVLLVESFIKKHTQPKVARKFKL